MRPGRAVVLCLIAVVLVEAGFFAGAPPDSSGNRFVLNRGARIPSVTSGTRTVAVPDGKPNAPGLIVQDLSPVLGTGWDALSFQPSGLTPPDVQVAVGPAHVVEAVNLALGVYSKEGVPLVTYDLSTFFATGSDFLSDPRIQYDGLSGRWFVTAGDFTTGQVLVAASTSVDPALGWSIYRVPSSATSECLDQPILGVGTLNVIVSVNVYSNCVSSTYTYNGAQFWVINKTDLVNGVLSPSVWPSPRYAADFSIHPVRMEGRSLVQYMVATLWDANTDTSDALQLFEVSGSPPGAVVVSEIDRAVASAGLPPPSTQLGTAYTLDTADFRISDAVWSRGLLWLGFNDVCPGLPSTACVRLIEVETTARTIRQDFRVSSTSRHYFYPALALDGGGNLAVLAGYASGSEYPGLVATGRLTGDPIGVLQPPVVVKAGLGVDQSWCDTNTSQCRYGDYFGSSNDPSDPTLVWFAGEFGRGSALGWGTYISAVRMKAMLTLNYSVDSGLLPAIGPMLHFVRNGTPDSVAIGAEPVTFLADPGTAWRIDSSFTTPSREARYVSRASDAPNLAGVANRSASTSFVYQVQYPLAIDVGTGGSVAYATNSTTHTVAAGTKDVVYVFAGRTVNLTAIPTSIFWAFTAWTGDLAGGAASKAIAVGQPRSIVARFALNWALITAISTVIVIAAVTATVFLVRRKRRARPPPFPPIPQSPPVPPPSPPEGPPPLT